MILVGGCTAGYVFVNEQGQTDLGLIHGSTSSILFYAAAIEAVILSWALYNIVPTNWKFRLAIAGHFLILLPMLTFFIFAIWGFLSAISTRGEFGFALGMACFFGLGSTYIGWRIGTHIKAMRSLHTDSCDSDLNAE